MTEANKQNLAAADNDNWSASIYTMQELMTKAFPEELWVIDGLLPEGVTVLSAAPASYKTWLLLHIAQSVSNGTPLFGKFATEKTGVLMIDEENTPRLLQQRLGMLGAPQDSNIHFRIGSNFKLEDAHIAKAIKFCENNSIKLITIDSLVRVYQGDENDANKMAIVFEKVRMFTAAGINVLITHHNRKGGKSTSLATEMRGSSDILASVDCHLAMTRVDGNRLTITQTKVRIAEEHKPVDIEVASTENTFEFTFNGVHEAKLSAKAVAKLEICEILTEGAINQKGILAALEESGSNANPKTIRSYLLEMVDDGTITVSSGTGSERIYWLNRTT